MATPAGIGGQIGFVSESTVGTAVTVDTFHAGLVSESIKQEIARIESQGLRAGRRTTSAWKAGAKTVGGSVNLELWNQPLATLLTHMFGTVNTAGDDPYTHTATPGDLTAKSLTVQVGRPGTTGTVHPFTYAGCKIPSWGLSCSVGEIPQLALTLSGWTEQTPRTVTDGVTTDEDATFTSASAAFTSDDVGKPISGTGIPADTTISSVTSATEVEMSAAATASGSSLTVTIGHTLATASYASGGEPFVFTEGSLSIAGSAVATVRSMNLDGNNTLAVDRHRIGSATVKEQLENGMREYTGAVEADFEALTAYQRFVTGTEAALVMAFNNGTDSLTITCNVRFDGETPELSGPELLTQNLPFKCLSGTSDAAAITAVLVNSESAAT